MKKASITPASCSRPKAFSAARPPAPCWPPRLRYCREQTEPKRVVSFVCDTGTRYLSKVYNDQWMTDQGLLHASTTATCAT
jgi:hypothetical protein